MKTPINELIEWIKDFDNRNLTVSRFDLDLKINKLLEKEKQVIIDAFVNGFKDCEELHEEAFYLQDEAFYIQDEAEQYYNETFKQ
jgi:hypothetical protein